MPDHSIDTWVASRISDSQTVDEAIDCLDALAVDPDINIRFRLGLERMALRLTTEDGRVTDAWRRYRLLAFNAMIEPALLAAHVAALGDLAVDLDDVSALSRARTELARLVAIARERPGDDWEAEDVDWQGFVELLRSWDRPDVLRAQRAFEAEVSDWLGRGGSEQTHVRRSLEALAADARTRAPDGAADIAIDGRRAFWAISILAGERNDLEAAWVQYADSADNMDLRTRATSLLMIARGVDRLHAQANLLIPLSKELDRFARDWPEPVSLAETSTRDALMPAIIELGDALRPR